jgi:hypothetical protein
MHAPHVDEHAVIGSSMDVDAPEVESVIVLSAGLGDADGIVGVLAARVAGVVTVLSVETLLQAISHLQLP